MKPMVSDASLFRWRKDDTNGQTDDVVTDSDVLRRAVDIAERERPYGMYIAQTELLALAERLESRGATP